MFDFKDVLQFDGNVVMPSTPSLPDDFPLAMAFVKNQTELNLYDTEKGYCAGTIFSDLDKPFLAGEK